VEFIFLDVRIVPGVSFVMECLLFLWSVLSLRLIVSPEEGSNGFRKVMRCFSIIVTMEKSPREYR
jgi:hypothetical protein